MHCHDPRIEPLDEALWSDEQRSILAPLVARNAVHNVFRTLVTHPEAFRAFLAWVWHVAGPTNTLSARQREIAVLRTAVLCGSGYAWAQHVVLGQTSGLTEAEIHAIKIGAPPESWSMVDMAIMRACDELQERKFVSDSTWAQLADDLRQEQCMDVIFTIAHYTQVAMILNSLGIQLDPELRLDPDLDNRPPSPKD